jgi:hypothetical protein
MLLAILISLLIWSFCAVIGFFAASFLTREKVLSQKYELLVAFLIAAALYYLLRYKAALFLTDSITLKHFFGAASFMAAERLALILCLPFFYMLSIMFPSWIAKPIVRMMVLLLIPFALKLAFGLAGIVPFVDESIVPDRIN